MKPRLDPIDPARPRRVVHLGYRLMSWVTHGAELTALLHRDGQVAEAQRRLRQMVRDLVEEAAQGGDVRGDVGADELAGYCIHALEAAGHAPTHFSVLRLVEVTLDGLRPNS